MGQESSATEAGIICDGTIAIPGGLPFAHNHKDGPRHSVYGTTFADLVHDPSGFFVCDGWKFLAPRLLVSARRTLTSGMNLNGTATESLPSPVPSYLRDVEALESLY